MVVEIPLTQGKAVLVNDVFARVVEQYNWYAQRCQDGRCWTAERRSGKMKMHRYIMSLHLGRFLTLSEEVDHINHDGLDNRIENLRLATQGQNNANQRVRVGPKSSKYKGVYWEQRKGKWRARIWVGGKQHSLGYFLHEEDAAEAYNTAALKYFGEYACLNNAAEA